MDEIEQALAAAAVAFTSAECCDGARTMLKRERMRAAFTGHWGNLRTLNHAIDAASKKPTQLAAFSAALGEHYTHYAATHAAGDTPVLDFVKWLLQWAVDNLPTIIALIMKFFPA